MTDISTEKQLRLIQALIRTSDYSHPLVLVICKDLSINPEDLKPKKLEYFTDKRTCQEIHELRFRHYETKRKQKLEQIASKILKSGIHIQKLLNKDLGPIHFQRHSLSPQQGESLNSSNKASLSQVNPLASQDLSQKKMTIQKKKLERVLKVMGNIKEIKYQQEVKKQNINKGIDLKIKKIEEEKMLNEEKRQQKINKINAKREEILKKKHEAEDRIEDIEYKRAQIQTDFHKGKRLSVKDSKASLSCRSMSRKILSKNN